MIKHFLLESHNKADLFAHALSTVTLSLLNRVSQSTEANLLQLGVSEDALTFTTNSTTKTNQEGDRKRIFRVHANGNDGEHYICPVTAMAIYFAVVGIAIGQIKIFGEGAEDSRFSKILRRTLEGPLAADLAAAGMKQCQISSHSLRKTGATLLGTGTIGGPTQAMINRRADWDQGGADLSSRYIKQGEEGDSMVGRYLSLLDHNKSSFALTPPYFLEEDSDVRGAVAETYPNIPPATYPAFRMMLASLVHHSRALIEMLPQNHRLFATPLFQNKPRLQRLRQIVRCSFLKILSVTICLSRCHIAGSGEPFISTGIPPNVQLLVGFEQLQRQVISLQSGLVSLAPQVVDAMREMLDERAAEMGQMTPAAMAALVKETITGFLESSGLAQRLHSPPAPPPPPAPPQLTFTGQPIPPDWRIPRGTSRVAFQMYCIGQPAQNIQPLRKLRGKFFSTKTLQNEFAAFVKIMKKLQEELESQGRWISQPSVEEVNNMFNFASSVIGIDETPAGQHKASLEWTTVSKKFSESAPKRRRTEVPVESGEN